MKRGGHGWVEPTIAKSEAMRRIRTAGTAPEIALRSRLHALNLRYRISYPVPGKPRRTIDIAFTRYRLAVFVDGCFWHGCPVHGTLPKTNAPFWANKISTNRGRDRDTDLALAAAGWDVLRIWEHTEPEEASRMILSALGRGLIKLAARPAGLRA
ncbi:very short patch repair endonuclease [Methylobacterium oryzihabitans]|nr:very short patch repair endonuclease [Methylobacterium oryzihabitans]